MVVVAACGRAGIKANVQMAGTILADLLVAQFAIIAGQRDTHRPRDVRLVLSVAGYALRGIELGQPVGVTRIAKLLERVRILSGGKLGLMTVETGFLQHLSPTKR